MVLDVSTLSSKCRETSRVPSGACQCCKLEVGNACILFVSLILSILDYIASSSECDSEKADSGHYQPLLTVAMMQKGVLLCISYFVDDQDLLGAVTCIFIVIPTVVIQTLSARWYADDGNLWHLKKCFCHLVICQPFERFFLLLIAWYNYRSKNLESAKLFEIVRLKNDVYLLRFVQVMMQSAPLLTYLLYLLCVHNKSAIYTGSAACVSLLALGWAAAALASVRHGMSTSRKQRHLYLGLVLHMFWWMLLVLSRAVAYVAFASVFGVWIFALVGVHWLAMTSWILLQRYWTSSSHVEKLLFASVVGIIYCFNFINIGDGKSCYRSFAYYSLFLVENVTMVLSWFFMCPSDVTTSFKIAVVCISLGAFLIGVTCTLVYYQFCHPSKDVQKCALNEVGWLPSSGNNPQARLPSHVICCVDSLPPRSFKQRRPSAATHHLELYTPSRLSPVLRATGNSTPGDVTQLDTSCTNTLNLDRFHHYSINASDCLSPMLTVRRHVSGAPDTATAPPVPFDIVEVAREPQFSTSTGQLCHLDRGGICSTLKLCPKNNRGCCDLCRLEAAHVLIRSQQPLGIDGSEIGSRDVSLLSGDDQWDLNSTDQLGSDLSKIHAGLPIIQVFCCDAARRGFGGDLAFGSHESGYSFIDSKSCATSLENSGEVDGKRMKT